MYATINKPMFFVTSTVVDWVDVFTRPLYKNIVVDSLRYCQQNKELEIYAWVLMTNHLHMIVGTSGVMSLGEVMRDFKKFTAKSVVRAIQENPEESRRQWLLDRFRFRAANDRKVAGYKFWQEDNYVESVVSLPFFVQKLNYIHLNPVRQEFVDRPEDYPYSSARNYAGRQGLIDVIVVK